MKSKQPLLLVSGIIILIAGAIVSAGWREMRRHAVLSCVGSIHQGLVNLNLSEQELPNVKAEWTLLSEAEGSRIILAASKIHSLDCSRVESGEPYLDHWGRQLQVGARALPGGKLEYKVWSKGSDGEAGTSDDLVSPYGEKAVSFK